jgi:hypothetical protein
VLGMLRDSGYLSGPGPRNSSRMSNRRLEGFVGPDSRRIEQTLAEHLASLYRSREVLPSLGLWSATQKWEGRDRRRFELDCALSEAAGNRRADRGDHRDSRRPLGNCSTWRRRWTRTTGSRGIPRGRTGGSSVGTALPGENSGLFRAEVSFASGLPGPGPQSEGSPHRRPGGRSYQDGSPGAPHSGSLRPVPGTAGGRNRVFPERGGDSRTPGTGLRAVSQWCIAIALLLRAPGQGDKADRRGGSPA